MRTVVAVTITFFFDIYEPWMMYVMIVFWCGADNVALSSVTQARIQDFVRGGRRLKTGHGSSKRGP